MTVVNILAYHGITTIVSAKYLRVQAPGLNPYDTATIASIKSWLKSGNNLITFFAVYLPTIRGKVDRFMADKFFSGQSQTA